MKRRKMFILTGLLMTSLLTAGFSRKINLEHTESKEIGNEPIPTVLLDEVPAIPDVYQEPQLQQGRTIELAKQEENLQEIEEEKPEEPKMTGTLIIADVSNYVNIRNTPNEEGEILGKLYDDSVGTLLEEPEEWSYIESGSVKGYVKTEYVLTGEAAQSKADEVGKRLAKVMTTTLKVREEATTDSSVIGLIPDGDVLMVREEVDGWVKVSVEEGDGFVSTDYLDVYTENVKAESVEEERARLEKEERLREEAKKAAKEALQKKEDEKKKAEAEKKKKNQNVTTQKKEKPTQPAQKEVTTATGGNSELGSQIAGYALQFVGNPYVYGGTSLTKGADCSGFVMSVFANFGISLPRTSGEQGASGSAVSSLEHAKAGDLIWYSGHIAIYTGGGRVVHASNKKEGIKTSNADYRTILGIRRIV